MTNDELAGLLEEAARRLRRQPDSNPRPCRVLLTDIQLAERLSISTRHIHALKARRAIPFIQLGRAIRFNPEAVSKALEKLTIHEVGNKPTRKGLR